MQKPSIFLSYSRADDQAEPFVERLYQELIAAGYAAWWDRINMPSRGNSFVKEIADAIAGSDRLLAVCGPHYSLSKICLQELDFAHRHCVIITPLLRQGDYPIVPQDLAMLHALDCRSSRRYPDALDELCRILDQTVAPPGTLRGVPALPDHYQPRTEDLLLLGRKVCSDSRVSGSTSAAITVQGMPGVGKSVLAAAFCRACDTRRYFKDGIFWMTAGKQSDDNRRLSMLRTIGLAYGDDPGHYRALEGAVLHLGEVLAGKACLIVLDDVWSIKDAEAFQNALGPQCKLLLTTRDAEIAHILGETYPLELLDSNQAIALLEAWLGESHAVGSDEKTAIVAECENLPFAIALCGALLSGGHAWSDVLGSLQASALEDLESQLLNYPHKNILRMVMISIESLPEMVRRMLVKMAVFPEDADIPEQTLVMFWMESFGIDEKQARKAVTKLHQMALVQSAGAAPDRTLALHDLIHDCLILLAGDISVLHKELVEAYASQHSSCWHTVPDDGYFHQHLVYHLLSAGELKKARALYDHDRWMIARLRADGYSFAGYISDLVMMWGRELETGSASMAYHVRNALIHTTVNSLSQNHIPELVARAVEIGEWTPERGMAVAPFIPDKARQSDLYVALIRSSRLDEEQRKTAVKNALLAACMIDDREDQLRAYSKIIPCLRDHGARQLWKDWGIEVIEKESSNEVQLLMIEYLASAIQEIKAGERLLGTDIPASPEVERLVMIALNLKNESSRAQAVAALIPVCDPGRASDHIVQAIAPFLDYEGMHTRLMRAVKEDAGEFIKYLVRNGLDKEIAKAFAALGPYLNPEYLDKALTVLNKMPHTSLDRVEAWAALLDNPHNHHPEEILSRILADISSIFFDPEKRLQIFARIAPHLGADAVRKRINEAFTDISQLTFPPSIAKAIIAMIPLLASKDLSRALACAEKIKWEQDRRIAIAALAPKLNRRQLNRQFRRNTSLPDKLLLLKMLCSMLVYLRPADRMKVSVFVSNHLDELKSVDDQVDALVHLLKVFPSTNIKQSVKMILGLIPRCSEINRVVALESLAEFLDGETAEDAIAIANGLPEEWNGFRADVLTAILPAVKNKRIQKKLIKDVLLIASTADKPYKTAEALAGLLPYLEGKGRQLALTQGYEAVKNIDEDIACVRMLGEYLPFLSGRRKKEALQLWSGILLALRDPWQRILRQPDLIPAGFLESRKYLSYVIRCINRGTIKDISDLACAITDFLEPEQIDKVFSSASKIQNPVKRAESLVALKPSMADSKWAADTVQSALISALWEFRSREREDLLSFLKEAGILKEHEFSPWDAHWLANHLIGMGWRWRWD